VFKGRQCDAERAGIERKTRGRMKNKKYDRKIYAHKK
jgi:hypothetical protein